MDILKLFSFKQWLMVFGASLFITIAVFGMGYMLGSVTGSADEKVACATKQTKAISNEVNKYAKTKKKILALPDLPLCRKWCERVRDDRKLCLQRCERGDIPLRE